MDDDFSRVPAGWYPDPLGLPQLRWWDNHAWTEHVAEARQPMVAQEARQAQTTFAWADDELPTRRERRERERETGGRADAGGQRPFKPSLLELAPPASTAKPVDQPAPEGVVVDESDWRPAAARSTFEPATADPTRIDPRPFDSPLFEQTAFTGARTTAEATSSATTAPERPTSAPDPVWGGERVRPGSTDPIGGLLAEPPVDVTSASTAASTGSPAASALFGERLAPSTASVGDGATAAPVGTATAATAAAKPAVHTAPVWIIALLPMLQLLVSLLVVSGIGLAAQWTVMAAVWLAPYPVVVVLAAIDRHLLKKAGIERPAHWAWAFLSSPVYLLARAAATVRAAGQGFSPLIVWVALGLTQIGSIVAVPGLAIATAPMLFAAEAENSIAADASIIGADLTVDCPDSPPLLIGQSFTCTATTADGGSFAVLVNLERSNGWIDWTVLDWGVNSLDR